MNTIKILSALCLLLGTSLHSRSVSAKTLSLDESIRLAFDNSPRLKKAQSQAEESSWKKVEAYSGFLPTISANASYLLGKQYMFLDLPLGGVMTSIPQVVPTSIMGLQGSLNLFDGFASWNRMKGAMALEKASNHEANWTKFALERDVKLLFYKALASRSLQTVAEQNLKTLEDHLKDISYLKRSGISTNYDVLRVEVQTSEAKNELMGAQDNVATAKDKLFEALGLSPTTTTENDPVGTLPVLKAEYIDGLKTETFEQRLDMKALQERVQALSDIEGAQGSYWVPRLALIGQYQYYNNRNDTFTDMANYRNAYTVGLSLTWNLFDGMSSIARSRQSVEQEYQVRRDLESATLRFKTDLEMWKRKYKYNCSVYKAKESDVSKAAESVRLAQEGRKAGVRTNTDLLDAELELFRARAGVVNSQINAIESLLNLELITGNTFHIID